MRLKNIGGNVAAYLFSPKESEERRNAKRRAERRSPMRPSQVARKPKANRKHPPRECYGVDGYRRFDVTMRLPDRLRRVIDVRLNHRLDDLAGDDFVDAV